MLNGDLYEDIQIIYADMMEYSTVARRHKWPSAEEDQLRAIGYWAYAALKRTGRYDLNKGFDDFTAEVEMMSSEEVTPDPS